MFRYAILVFLLISLVVVRAKDDAPDEEPHQDAYDAIAGPGGMYESNFTQEHNGCAACTTYASALRRVAWDKFPFSDTATAEDKEQRRKELVNDDRLEDVTMDALLAVLRHYAYAPKYRRYAPLEALIRAKALTDKQLELAQRQALHGGDQGLITFLHGDVMIEEGEAIEKYAGRDVTKGVVLDDYERLPGSGTCDPEMSHECAERVASFRIAKDHKRDVSERTAVASLICQRFCSTNDLRSLLPMEAEDLGVESLAAIHRLEEIAKKAEEQREEEELELLRVRIAEEAERERQAQLALEAELIEGGTAPPATHDEDPPVVDEAPTADEEPLLHIPVDDQEHADAKEGTVTDADPSEM